MSFGSGPVLNRFNRTILGIRPRMRYPQIDTFKAISILAVILIHTHPFADFTSSERTQIEILINQVCRFCVPYFFIASGFLWAKKICDPKYTFSELWPRIKFLCMVYVLWCGIYLVINLDVQQILSHSYPKLVYWKLVGIFNDPLAAIFSGTKTHLWFLPALIMSQIFIYGLSRVNFNLLLPISIAVYFFGVLAGAYQNTPLGIEVPIDTRNGLFFAGIFIVLGIVIYKYNLRISTLKAAGLIVLGYIGQFYELKYIANNTQMDLTQVEYVFSTLLIGAGFLFLALSIKKELTSINQIGKYSLGLYLVHMIFVDLMRPLGLVFPILVYAMVIPFGVYICSYFTIQVYQRIPLISYRLGNTRF